MTPDEYEALIAQGMDPNDINRPGGVNLGGLPNVGNGTPAFRNQKQRKAVANLHARGDDEPDAQEGPQRAIRRPFGMQAYSGANPVQQGFINEFGPTAQARHLQGMIAQTQGAIQDENDSRVAQSREQGRMAHEREMEAMRQEALLQRLAMEQREREKDRILQKQLTSGITTRKLVNGRWVDV
jgi:hypothetical protein